MEKSLLNFEKLSYDNYATWSYRMAIHLQVEECWEQIVNPPNLVQIPEDADAAAVAAATLTNEANKKKDLKAIRFITLGIESSQIIHVKGKSTSKEVWDALKLYHQRPSLSTITQLRKKLGRADLAPGASMEKHIQYMFDLFDKLANLGNALTDSDAVGFLLASLNSDYDNLITALEAWDPERLTLGEVKMKLIAEWEKKKNVKKNIKDRLGPVVQPRVSQEGASSSDSSFTCGYCKEEGHIKRNCAKLKAKENKETANMTRCHDWYLNEFSLACSENKDSDIWIIDSGATAHIAKDASLFPVNLEKPKVKLVVANGEEIGCEGISDIQLSVSLPFTQGLKKGALQHVNLSKAMHIPKIHNNLVSVSCLVKRGFEVIFRNKGCFLRTEDGHEIHAGDLVNGLYVLKTRKTSEQASLCIHQWHRRLAHRNLNDVRAMKQRLKFNECNCSDVCESCIRGKMIRKSFPKTASPMNQPLDCVVSDICGPMQTLSLGKSRYFITFMDIYSGYCEVYFMKRKDEAFGKIKKYVEKMKNQLGKKPKIFRTDQGSEYKSAKVQDYLEKEGIQYQCTAGYSPEQNGVAERKNRTLMEAARSMLIDAKFPNSLWAEAVGTANHIQNHLIGKRGNDTPYESMFNKPSKLQDFHEFGCDVYVKIPDEKRQKLDPKATKMKFVGYHQEAKAYKLVDKKYSIFVSREVKFLDSSENWNNNRNEQERELVWFPFTDSTEDSENLSHSDSSDNSDHSDNLENSENLSHSNSSDDLNHSENSNNSENNDDSNKQEQDTATDEEIPEHDSQEENNETEDSHYSDAEDELEENPEEESIVRHSSRINFGQPPKRFDDYVTYSAQEKFREPKSYEEALKSPQANQWTLAMQEELENIEKNNTWEEIQLPKNRKAIDSKWVYKVKYDENGIVSKFKARLVARGFTQKFGVDYDEIFAPVVRSQTFRMLLSIAGTRDYTVKHYDIETAFLNGELTEEIYLKSPPGFKTCSGKVLKLKKSLYGLKQAAKVWNEALHDVLIKAQFTQSEADRCLYKAREDEKVCYLIVHVDDMILASNDDEFSEKCMNPVREKFKVKNLGEAKHFLGIDINKSSEGDFKISQGRYIDKIVEETNLQDAKTSKFPLNPGYYKIDSEALPTNDRFRKIIGQLLYLSVHSRPDISASVSILSQRVQNPRKTDLEEAKRVVRYLKGTRNLQLLLSNKSESPELVGYSDADWAEDTENRKSNSGSIVKINGGTIDWKCRKQTLVALSSTEAEYIAASETCKEILWLQQLQRSFDIVNKESTTVFVDNQSCIKIIQNEKSSNRSKHIDTKFHFIRDLATKKQIKFRYVPTEENIADMLTKPLNSVKLKNLRTATGLLESNQLTS